MYYSCQYAYKVACQVTEVREHVHKEPRAMLEDSNWINDSGSGPRVENVETMAV